MFVLAIISVLLLLGLATTGAFVESISPDELTSMGVARRS
jgi:hypothetical protein